MIYKLDDNHNDIVAAFRAVGCRVVELARSQTKTPGIPDLLVGTRGGQIVFVEVKTMTGKLSPPQKAFFDEWEGYPVFVARTTGDVLTIAEFGND